MLNFRSDDLYVNSKKDETTFPARVLVFDTLTRTYRPFFVAKITSCNFDPAPERLLQKSLGAEPAQGESIPLNKLSNGLDLEMRKLFGQAGEIQFQLIHKLDNLMIRQTFFECSTKRMLPRNLLDDLAFEKPLLAKHGSHLMNSLEIRNRQAEARKIIRMPSSPKRRGRSMRFALRPVYGRLVWS